MCVVPQLSEYQQILTPRQAPNRVAYEASLMRRVAEGDACAFRVIVEAHHARVFRVARRIVGEEEASDVTQEVFLRVYAQADRFRGESQLATWLHRVTCNTALMVLRRRRPTEELPPDWDLADPEPVDRRYEQREELSRIQAVWGDLAEPHREILDLRLADDLSVLEIAERLALTVPATKSRMHRARLELIEKTRVRGGL